MPASLPPDPISTQTEPTGKTNLHQTAQAGLGRLAADVVDLWGVEHHKQRSSMTLRVFKRALKLVDTLKLSAIYLNLGFGIKDLRSNLESTFTPAFPN